MLFGNLSPQPINVFGGLVTLMDRLNLPANVSPTNQNVAYFPGGVQSRYGTTILSTCATGGLLNTTGLCNFINLQGTKAQVAYFYDYTGASTVNGIIQSLNGGSLAAIDNSIGSAYMYGQSAYGKAWLTLTTGLIGDSWPRQWDGTNLLPIGMSTPANPSMTANEIFNAGTTLTAGYHLFRVTYEDATGATSPPSYSCGVTTTGGSNTAVQITNIPIGPTGTVRRVIWGTTVSDGAYTDSYGNHTTTNYYTLRNSAMILGDNSTTSVTFAFTDSTLALGENSGTATPYQVNLFTMLSTVPPCLGVVFYKSRAFYFNLLGSITPRYVSFGGLIKNYDFKGAIGITADWGGVSSGVATGIAGAAGQVVYWTADGVTVSFLIAQSMTGNYEPTPQFTPGITYGVRARVKRGATAFTNGSFTIKSSVGTNYSTPLSGIGTTWKTIETGALIYGQNSANPGPAPLSIGIDNSGGAGTPGPNGAILYLDWIDFYPVTQTRDGSKVFGSKVFGPQTIDTVTGPLFVQKDNGQDIKAAFVLFGNLYFVKDRSIFVTNDNGGEPATWSITLVDDTIGCPGPNCVAEAEGVAVIASRSGLYLFNGAIGDKLSHEIEPTWKSINWQYANTINVAFDTERRNVYVAVPTGANTTPNVLLVLNYDEGWGDCSENGGIGRKWTTWTIPAASLLLAEQVNGSRLLYIGGNDNTGSIYYYNSSVVNDNGAAINSYYETAPVGVPDGPTLFGGLLLWTGGTGTATVSYTTPAGANTSISNFTPASPESRDWQFLMNLPNYEKVGFRIGSNAIGASWSTNRITPYLAPSPFLSPARGSNP